MANEENLKPLNRRTQRERKEISSMGAKAANEARREKRKAKEAALMFASLPARKEIKPLLDELGVDATEQNMQMAMLAALANRGLTGDPQAVKLYFEIMGEPPAAAVDLNGNMQFNGGGLKETLAELRKKD